MLPQTPVFQELINLRTAFEDIRALLAKGIQVDLTGMDKRVQDFCTNVQQSDAATRQQIEPDFVALLGLLNTLETDLRRLADHAKLTADSASADPGARTTPPEK